MLPRTLGDSLRVAEKLRDRLLQAAAFTVVLGGAAALAAPVAHRVGAVRVAVAQALLDAANQQAPAPEKLVWIGADVDGDGQADFANPTGQDTRSEDAYGFGAFGASRVGGAREHEGVDFIAEAGQTVTAPISGFVTKIGYAYPGDQSLKFVEITNPALHYEARVFYVDPAVRVGDAVALGHPIGRHHTLERKYPGGMTDHVHLEIINRRGVRIDATQVIEARYEAAGASRG